MYSIQNTHCKYLAFVGEWHVHVTVVKSNGGHPPALTSVFKCVTFHFRWRMNMNHLWLARHQQHVIGHQLTLTVMKLNQMYV